MRIFPRLYSFALPLVSLLIPVAGMSQAHEVSQSGSSLQQIFSPSQLWSSPPATVKIVGTSTHDGITESIAVTATSAEEVLTEYDSKKIIETPQAVFVFQQKTNKWAWIQVKPGFADLDITGSFLLTQLIARPVKIQAPQSVNIPSGAAQSIHVSYDRPPETHYGAFKVTDDVDLYVGSDGLLKGVMRSFYPQSKAIGYTIGYQFSEYRETNGVVLPYHIDKYVKGQIVEKIEVKSYALDVPAPPMMFQPGGEQ